MFLNKTYDLSKINNGQPYYINFTIDEYIEFKIILSLIKSMKYEIDYNNGRKISIYGFPPMNKIREYGLFIHPGFKKCRLDSYIIEKDSKINNAFHFKKFKNKDFKFVMLEKK